LDDFAFVRSALLAGGQVGQGIKGSGISVWGCLFARDKNHWGSGRVRVSPHAIPEVLPFLLDSLDDEVRPQMATRLFVEFFHRGNPTRKMETDPFSLLLDAGAKPLSGLMEILSGSRHESRHHVEWFLLNLVAGKPAISPLAWKVFDGTGLGPHHLDTARFLLNHLGRPRSDMTRHHCQELLTGLERDALASAIAPAGEQASRKALRL
jgi:hypothetical protein